MAAPSSPQPPRGGADIRHDPQFAANGLEWGQQGRPGDPLPYFDAFKHPHNGNRAPAVYPDADSSDASTTSSSSSTSRWRGRRMLPPSIRQANSIRNSKHRTLKDSIHSNLSRSTLISPPPRPGARADRKTQPVHGGQASLGPITSTGLKRPPPPPVYPPSDDSEESIEELDSDEDGTSSESDTRIGSTNPKEDGEYRRKGKVRGMQYRTARWNAGDDSDTSSSSEDSEEQRHHRLDKDYERLEDKRDEIQELRGLIHQQRRKLKSSRETKDTADNSFMAILRPLLTKGAPDSHSITLESLDSRFKHMQSTRTEYQELEAVIEELEDKLSRAETQATFLERQFLKALYTPSGPQRKRPHDFSDEDDVPPSRTSLLGIPTARREDTHPLYDEFMSAVGNLQLAEEHLEDLIMNKLVAEQEQEHRRQVQQLHPRESMASRRRHSEYEKTIRNFESLHREAQDEIKKCGSEVSRLKALCEEKGVFPQHAPMHEIYSFQPDIYDDDDDDMSLNFEGDESLAHPQYPLLLTNPSHILNINFPLTAKRAFQQAMRLPDDDPTRQAVFAAASKELNIEMLVSDFKEGDKSDLINRWLLQKLRTSPMEVELLHSTFLSHLSIWDINRWEQDVLYFWSRDDANIPPDSFQGPVTSADVEAPRFTKFPDDIDILPRTDSWARLSQRRHQSLPDQSP